MRVSLPADVLGVPGHPLIVPVTLGPSSVAASVSVGIEFDPAVLSVTSVEPAERMVPDSLAVDASQPGRVLITGAVAGPSAVDGRLARIEFFAVGRCGKRSDLTVRTCDVNGGDVACQPSNGRAALRCGVSGKIEYYATSEPVTDAMVYMRGEPEQAGSTNSLGQFAFDGLSDGSWQLDPLKTAGYNGAVSALDAAYVLQSSAGLRSLDSLQGLACDVTGNGDLSPLDAARILQFVVGRLARFPVAEACGSDWAFVPNPDPMVPERVIDPRPEVPACQRGGIAVDLLDGVASEQNFSALLFGDCTGNWREESAMAGAAAMAPGETTVRLIRRRRPGVPRAEMPVYVDREEPFSALELLFVYDPARVRIAGVRPLPGARGALVQHDVGVPGVLAVAVASPRPLTPGGLPVVALIVQSISTSSRDIDVRLLQAQVDEQDSPAAN